MILYNFEHLLILKVTLSHHVALNLLDYEEVVKNPMDLGTVRKKFNDGRYIYAEEVLDDIQLIWDNCKLYNRANEVLRS